MLLSCLADLIYFYFPDYGTNSTNESAVRDLLE